MFEVKGNYTTAKVFSKEYLVENSALEQVKDFVNNSILEGCKVAFMPDIHAGAGCTVGSVFEIKDKINPNYIGVDIGCGVYTTIFKTDKELNKDTLTKLDSLTREFIPSGQNIRELKNNYLENEILDEAYKILLKLREKHSWITDDLFNKFLASCGTLGGGNHFIEIGKIEDSENTYALFVHSGSRNLGVRMCNYNLSLIDLQDDDKIEEEFRKQRVSIIDSYKSEGRQSEIGEALKDLKDKITKEYTKDWLEGQATESYLEDVINVSKFAQLNRKTISYEVIKLLNISLTKINEFDTMHNYIDENRIARKGAIEAKHEDLFVIPMNMRDGVLICKGNQSNSDSKDWLNSAPHGAGRIMSRKSAKSNLNITEFENQMKDIVSSSVNRFTLDEAPNAYKPYSEIVSELGNHIEIIDRVIPIWNFKAIS